jgi:hypothetical protein
MMKIKMTKMMPNPIRPSIGSAELSPSFLYELLLFHDELLEDELDELLLLEEDEELLDESPPQERSGTAYAS